MPLIEEFAAQRRDRRHIGRRPVSRATRSPARSRAHPLRGQGYDFDVPLLAGRFCRGRHRAPASSTSRRGMAPTTGSSARRTACRCRTRSGRTASTCRACRSSPGAAVYRPDGKPGDANEAVIAAVEAAGGLLARGTLVHSYPHSWRSKAPLIFRNTPQWFISMEANGLRQKALEAIDETRWVPPQGRTASRAMVESRPDWCVSRQRAWGVPIPVFAQREDRRAAARPGASSSASPPRSSARAPMPGSAPTRATSSATPTTRPSGSRSPTSSRCGSIRARPMPLCWSSGRS